MHNNTSTEKAMILISYALTKTTKEEAVAILNRVSAEIIKLKLSNKTTLRKTLYMIVDRELE